jgi:hypothetical protein
MTAAKTRPSNNFHCFEGMGRPYWQAIARGMRPTGISMGVMGASVDLIMEGDGNVVQNGGMQSPQETKIPPGTYFRFFGTIAHNRYGGASAMAGGWWVDFETALAIRDWAVRFDLSLAQAAAALLVIPPEWHDCGYVGRGRLKTAMKAWVGHGKPATGTLSPDNAARRTAGVNLHAAPSAQSVKQYFLPGDRTLIASVFDFDTPVQVIAKGKYPLGL